MEVTYTENNHIKDEMKTRVLDMVAWTSFEYRRMGKNLRWARLKWKFPVLIRKTKRDLRKLCISIWFEIYVPRTKLISYTC